MVVTPSGIREEKVRRLENLYGASCVILCVDGYGLLYKMHFWGKVQQPNHRQDVLSLYHHTARSCRGWGLQTVTGLSCRPSILSVPLTVLSACPFLKPDKLRAPPAGRHLRSLPRPCFLDSARGWTSLSCSSVSPVICSHLPLLSLWGGMPEHHRLTGPPLPLAKGCNRQNPREPHG